MSLGWTRSRLTLGYTKHSIQIRCWRVDIDPVHSPIFLKAFIFLQVPNNKDTPYVVTDIKEEVYFTPHCMQEAEGRHENQVAY